MPNNLLFNETVLNRIVNNPDGAFANKLRLVSETVEANYNGVVDKIWQNQSALARPTIGYELSNGQFGLQSEIGISSTGRTSEYMENKFIREKDWVKPAVIEGWDAAL